MRKLEGMVALRGSIRVWSMDREVFHTAETLATHDRYLAERKILTDLQRVFSEIKSWFVRVHEVDPLNVTVVILGVGMGKEKVETDMRTNRGAA